MTVQIKHRNQCAASHGSSHTPHLQITHIASSVPDPPSRSWRQLAGFFSVSSTHVLGKVVLFTSGERGMHYPFLRLFLSEARLGEIPGQCAGDVLPGARLQCARTFLVPLPPSHDRIHGNSIWRRLLLCFCKLINLKHVNRCCILSYLILLYLFSH